MRINVPIPAILAIYAKENGRGMDFDPEDSEDTPPPPENKPPQRPQLRVVK
jgi:stringent starvation protein B